MRLITIILSLFFVASSNSGCSSAFSSAVDTTKHKKLSQLSVNELRRAEKAHKDSYDDCAFTQKYSIRQRLKHYPFSTAVKIIAVSYKCEFPPDVEIFVADSTQYDTLSKKLNDTVFDTGLHINNSRLNWTSIKEFIVLNSLQVNNLTNIIYNTDFKVHDVFNSTIGGACYNPRNALLFYDKNGNIFDYLEICFECHESKSMSDRIKVGTECTQKYELLRRYFSSLGINYGTTNHRLSK